jgi:phage terminase large subunit-like protein
MKIKFVFRGLRDAAADDIPVGHRLLSTKDALERIRDNTPARNWSALYQQNPVPEEGELFSADMLGLRDRTDEVVMGVRGWDSAGSADGDWTVGVLMGRTRDGRCVVGNVVRLRGRPDKVEEAILEATRLDVRGFTR